MRFISKIPGCRSLCLACLLALIPASPCRSAGATPENDIRRDAAVKTVEIVLPSVVNISTETMVMVQDPLDQLFQEFFGPYQRGRPNSLQSLGSGVIIDETGFILTNYHVVQRATHITVTLSDGRSFEAQALAADPKVDVALLKLLLPKPAKFAAIKFAADDDLILGETVLALGNPFGLGESVSRGILSSKTRRPPSENQPEELEIADWLQTDAAINPGNSGGPLVNLHGELIGINVAVFRQAQGIGFAIPIKRVSQALTGMFTPEQLRSLWFGARLASEPPAVQIQSVEPGSPADKAGLRPGDVIQQIGSIAPKSILEANRALISQSEKRDISMLIRRQHQSLTLSLRLVPESNFFNEKLIQQRLGAMMQELTPKLAAAFGTRASHGLLVAEVEPDSPADKAGLRSGQIIQTIDGQPVESIVDAAKRIYSRKKNQGIQLTVAVQRRLGAFISYYTAATTVYPR